MEEGCGLVMHRDDLDRPSLKDGLNMIRNGLGMIRSTSGYNLIHTYHRVNPVNRAGITFQ